jgi:hypothetical protein
MICTEYNTDNCRNQKIAWRSLQNEAKKERNHLLAPLYWEMNLKRDSKKKKKVPNPSKKKLDLSET